MSAVDLAVRAVLAERSRLPVLDMDACRALNVELADERIYMSLGELDRVLWLRSVLTEYEASRWAPVTERLPEAGAESVLVTYESNGNVFVGEASWGEHTWWFDALGTLPFSVIAWQPLPKPWVKP